VCGGAAGISPVTLARSRNAQPSANGTTPPRTQASHIPTRPRRRRTRASPSTAATSTGRARAATSSRIAHSGSTLLRITSSERGERATGVEPSSAVMLRSTPRPNACMRSSVTALEAPGPRSPDGPTRTAGSPSASRAPCSPTVSGTASRAKRAASPAPPGAMPVSILIAASTVRWSSSGAAPRLPSDHGTTSGRRRSVPAGPPSTSDASTGPPGPAPSSAAPAAPAAPAVVEASTIVRPSVRPPRTLASSSRAAVLDSEARDGAASASRWATTRIRRPEKPVRSAITFTRRRSPAAVWPWNAWVRTANPAWRRRAASSAARPSSARDPALRRGNAACSRARSRIAACASNASGASGEVSGRGRSRSENPAITSAKSTGRNAAL